MDRVRISMVMALLLAFVVANSGNAAELVHTFFSTHSIPELQWYQQKAEDFFKETGIKVTVLPYAKDRAKVLILSGQTPDVMWGSPNHMVQEALGGIFADLRTYLAKDRELSAKALAPAW